MLSFLVLGFPRVAGGDEPAGQRAFLTLVLNTADKGQVLAIVRSDDVLVRTSDLTGVGLTPPAQAVSTLGGTSYVSLKALGAGVTFHVDTDALALVLDVPPAMLGASTLDLDQFARDVNVSRSGTSGFFNYALGAPQGLPLRFDGELGVSGRGAVLTADVEKADGGGFSIARETLNIDNFAKARRIEAGFTTADMDDFAGTGGVTAVGGVSIQRNLSLNPNLLRNSAASVTGVAQTPSTIEIYVNGTLVRRDQVPAGPFELTNLPLTAGANDTTIVVRDAYGRTQTFHKAQYLSEDLLRAGATEYALVAGLREDPETTADNNSPMLAARYRTGRSDKLTLGGRLVVSPSLGNVAASASWGTRLGEFSTVAAASMAPPLAPDHPLFDVEQDVPSNATPPPAAVTVAPGTRFVDGTAFAVAFKTVTKKTNVGLSFVAQSPLYASLSRPSLADRALTDFAAFASVNLHKHLSVTLQADDISYRDSGRVRDVALGPSFAIGKFAAASVTYGTRTAGGVTGPSLTVQINATIGHAASAYYGTDLRDGVLSKTLDIEHSSPGLLGPSFGLQENSSPGDTELEVDSRLRTQHGDLEAIASEAAGHAATELDYSGALAFAGGGVFVTRPILGSYAVIDVSGLSGIPVSVNNQDVGTTNRSGRLLATNLFPYQKNSIKIDGSNAPDDVLFESTDESATPMYRSGTVVRFPAQRIRAYTGHLRIAAQPPVIPRFGRLTLEPGGSTSDIGADGAFYFDTVTPGSYQAKIEYAGGACTFPLVIHAGTATVTNLGELTCEPAK